MAILNVLPAEYRLMQQIAVSDNSHHTDNLAAWCHERFGCKLGVEYAIKVHWDVPGIPWLSRQLHRLEE